MTCTQISGIISVLFLFNLDINLWCIFKRIKRV
jgi:hypothetical protein